MNKVLSAVMLATMSLLASPYTISQESITPYSSAQSVCESEFGNNAKVATWGAFKKYLETQEDLNITMNIIGLTEYDSSAVVAHEENFWDNGDRHYFVARHEGALPINYLFLAHENAANNYVSLGSWNDYNYPVLCKIK